MTLEKCRTILVPVDFSPVSARAVREALHLARLMEAQVLILHVIHDDSEKPGFYHKKSAGKKGIRHLRDAAREMMEEFLWRHDLPRDAGAGGVVLTTALASGLPAPRIVEEASRIDAGLILMATQAKDGLKGLLKGSVAREVLKRAPMPLLILKGEAE